MAFLRLLCPEGLARPVRDIPLDRDLFTIGRDTDNTLVLEGGIYSRHHARLQRSSEGWVLEDLGSASGTLVQGVRITKHLLRNGDTVQVCDQAMVFFAEESAPFIPLPTVFATAPTQAYPLQAQHHPLAVPHAPATPPQRPHHPTGSVVGLAIVGGGIVLLGAMALGGYFLYSTRGGAAKQDPQAIAATTQATAIGRTIRDCASRMDAFSRELRHYLETSRIAGTDKERELNRDASALDREMNNVKAAWEVDHDIPRVQRHVSKAIDAAQDLDSTMLRHRMSGEPQSVWRNVRSDLGRLAEAFDLPKLRWQDLEKEPSADTADGASSRPAAWTFRRTYRSSETVVVLFKNIPTNSDAWIDISKAADGAGSYQQYYWTYGKSSGEMTFSGLELEPGAYEVRVHFTRSDSVNRRSSFRVE